MKKLKVKHNLPAIFTKPIANEVNMKKQQLLLTFNLQTTCYKTKVTKVLVMYTVNCEFFMQVVSS